MMQNTLSFTADPEQLTRTLWELRNIDEAIIHFACSSILAHDREADYLENLDQLIQGRVQLDKHQNSGMPINTYPFGNKKERLSHRYLAVNRSTKESFNHFFSKIVLPHMETMIRELPENEEKTALLIVDHWNASAFEKYESLLTEYALKHQLWTILLLVTRAGVVQIPYLPNRRLL